MKQVTFADGIVRLGGEELPGLLQSLRVDGKVKYDKQKIDGASGDNKTPQGWEDQTVVVSLVLVTDDESDCYEKLDAITPYFRKADGAANPEIYTITNRHLKTRGIRQVVFDRFESNENNATDEIRVTLGFTEHNPPIVRTEENAAKTPTPGEAAKQTSAAPEEDDAIISGDLS